MIRKFFVAAMLCTGLSAAGVAEEGPTSPEGVLGTQPYESPSCVQTDFHELDFLNGNWAMKVLKDGRWIPAGFAEQRPALGGCAVMMTVSFDQWGDYYGALTGRDGFAAIILSSYDIRAHNWRQVWSTDMGGMLSVLRGRKFKDGARFVGNAPDASGPELQRQEWLITGADTREFTFEQSLDGGKNWSVIGKVQLVRRAP